MLSDEPVFTDVFTKGDGGFAQIRIPSIIVTKRGTLLAFAEGRSNASSDQANNKIILKRSSDSGRTWGTLQVVAKSGEDSLNNPCAVVERTSGRIFLVYQRLPAGIKEASSMIPTGYEGPNLCSCFLVSSSDDGFTWSPPQDITRSAKHPSSATTICSGPGIGIQLIRGTYAGRLILPFNEGPFYKWNNYSVFSDDRGKTWRCGENAPGAFVKDQKGQLRSQVNEVQMVELSDGSIMLNSRQFAGEKRRKSAMSKDGGVTWSEIKDVPEIQDPSCMASIFRASFGPGRRNVLLFSGPDALKRSNGTIRVSFDDGKSWTQKKVLVPGDFAYSVLARLNDGNIGCLFETDEYQRISFASFALKWIIEQKNLKSDI